ncbi:MAG TPA: helix-turn-helix transcriptional regulator [Bradyrhizobium sp.]|nr:helix-turn-helix transcriptional regulator [Bradyrhizobium sp.]
MTGGATDGHVDQVVKARWLAIGLSQADLAEVLGGTLQLTSEDGNGSNYVDADRLMRVAEALQIPIDFFYDQTIGTEREAPDVSSAQRINSLQSVLALRLLRAFQDMTDLRTKEVLILLAEQIVKCQASRGGDGG